MPTPSSNPPPNPPHEAPAHSFPSCPEDAHHRSQSTRSRANTASNSHEVQAHPSGATVATSPLDTAHSHGTMTPTTAEPSSPAAMETEPDGPASTAPSSRAATSSPTPDRPATATTAITTPATSFRSDDFESSAHRMDVDDAKGKNCEKTRAWLATCDTEPAQDSAQDQNQDKMATARVPVLSTVDGWVMADDAYTDELSPSTDGGFPSSRMLAWSSSSLLRAGSRFQGTQQSDKHVYDVQVEIQHVDLRESYLCGYLKISCLTPEHPTLTTFFEGEIIGSKYSFATHHPSWGASEKIDYTHWSMFNAFRPLAKQAKHSDGAHALQRLAIPDVAQQEHVFMRWKERFLVPDHRVRTISGASFEGFYYICFNQIKGEISGIYFHHKSERFQHLELKHVADRGCFHSLEFR